MKDIFEKLRALIKPTKPELGATAQPVRKLIPIGPDTVEAFEQLKFSLASIADESKRKILQEKITNCYTAVSKKNHTQEDWNQLNARLNRIDELIIISKPGAAIFLLDRTTTTNALPSRTNFRTIGQAQKEFMQLNEHTLPHLALNKIEMKVQELEDRARGNKKFEKEVAGMRRYLVNAINDPSKYTSIMNTLKFLDERIPKTNINLPERKTPPTPSP